MLNCSSSLPSSIKVKPFLTKGEHLKTDGINEAVQEYHKNPVEKFYNKKYYNPEYHYYVDGGDVLRLYSERDNSKGEPIWTDVLDSYYYNVCPF